jgi:hypothetical protein
MACVNLQQRQRDVITRMLALNEDEQSDVVHWKVLVYDKFAQEILAPLLNVAELRRHGITLHLYGARPY